MRWVVSTHCVSTGSSVITRDTAVTLWLGAKGLAVEFARDTLARYEVEYHPAGDGLRQGRSPELFETVHHERRPRPRLFKLENVLGESWPKPSSLNAYAPLLLAPTAAGAAGNAVVMGSMRPRSDLATALV